MTNLALKEKVIITPVSAEYIDQTWEYCQQFFDGANRFRYQNFQPDEVFKHIKDGMASLIVALVDEKIKGACVVLIDETLTGGKSLFIPIMGGIDLLEWGHQLDDALTKIAKANECKTIEYIGRKGFSRLDKSYIEDGRIYVKELDNV